MSLPKIEFKEMTLEENITFVKWAYFKDDGILSVHDYTVKCFPELDNLNSNLSCGEIYKLIEDVVTKEYNDNKEKIKSEVERYRKLWDKYNDKYFELLTSYLNIDWPENKKEITATVGVIPVCPRYLDDFSFSLCTDIDDFRVISVCAHETLHFLWFEKWRQLHPEISRIEYDSPYLSWQYSEMVTDPILNNKPFSEMFDFNEKGYDSFYELYENGTKVMDNLRDIYSRDISVEDKINTGYDYISNFLNNNKNKSN